MTTQWSVVSGPGAVTFANPASARTQAAFASDGTYVLRLTASDTALTSSDDVTVTVLDPVMGPAPTVSIASPADGASVFHPVDNSYVDGRLVKQLDADGHEIWNKNE